MRVILLNRVKFTQGNDRTRFLDQFLASMRHHKYTVARYFEVDNL